MAFGQFDVTIDGAQYGLLPEQSAEVRVNANLGTLKFADVDRFSFPRPVVNVTLPYTLTLDTDVAAGGGNSTVISYHVEVTTPNGGRISTDFAARPAGSTISLTDVTEQVNEPISDTSAARIAAEAARDAAQTAAASVQREQADGVAGLTSAGKLYEARIPDRLSDAGLQSTYATTAFQDLVAKCDANTGNVTLLILSDSTAAASDGWVEQAVPLLAARFPHLSISLSEWVDGTPGSYGTAAVTTGTGPNTLYIYNASVAGMTWQYHFDSSRWPTMIAALTPDAVVVSLGHNDNIATVHAGNVIPQRNKAIVFLEFLRTLVPSAAVTLMSQNPLTGTYTAASQNRATMLRSLARARGYGFVDVCKAFLDDGRTIAGTLISGDNTHPTTAGYAVWAARFMQDMTVKATGRVPSQPAPSFTTLGQNLISDPTFADYDGSATPNGVALTNATHSWDTTNFETGSGALKLTKAAGGSASYVEFTLPTALVKGRTLIAVARIWVPTAVTNTAAGQVSLRSTAGIGGSETWAQRGQFLWRADTYKVEAGATFAKLRLYVDPTTGASLDNITIDRWGVFFGDIPMDPAPAASIPRVANGVNVQAFTTSGTWTKPVGATAVSVVCIGAGGGGGAGSRHPSGTSCSGGAGGGGGAYSVRTFPAAVLSATETVGIGSGGAGAAGQTVDASPGATGSTGSGATTFGSRLRAAAGTGGAGGGTGTSTAGSSGSGMVAGSAGASGPAGAAGSSASGSAGGAGGGGGGGGISTTPAAFAGGSGSISASGGAAAGSAGTSGGGAGGVGTSSSVNESTPGSGGGGGGSSITGAGGTGGAGGAYGAGGGGGGASLNGNTSGAGGAGAGGLCIVISY